ncbi:hypothetical protein, partial [Coleofasciculus sp. E1-EBD-02]|uniref:hypothetical protein n=1 Tax=Coleofasciculus sp. E1-EBD-02 TaxID=3068481 RepID=UPI0032F498B2
KGKSSGSFSQVILGWLVTVVIRYHLPPSVSPILDKDRVRSQDLIHSGKQMSSNMASQGGYRPKVTPWTYTKAELLIGGFV